MLVLRSGRNSTSPVSDESDGCPLVGRDLTNTALYRAVRGLKINLVAGRWSGGAYFLSVATRRSIFMYVISVSLLAHAALKCLDSSGMSMSTVERHRFGWYS